MFKALMKSYLGRRNCKKLSEKQRAAIRDIESPYRVGRYRVDVKGFEDFLDFISL
jgi:hypothetical protein